MLEGLKLFQSLEHLKLRITFFFGTFGIKAIISRRKAYFSVMCGHFCIGFIIMLNNKNLTDFTSLFPPNSVK